MGLRHLVSALVGALLALPLMNAYAYPQTPPGGSFPGGSAPGVSDGPPSVEKDLVWKPAENEARWGGAGAVLEPVDVSPSGDSTHAADLHLRNVLTAFTPDYSEIMLRTRLDDGDLLELRLIVRLAPGDAPDVYTAAPLGDYIAVPETVVLDEDAGDTIRIFRTEGFLMGCVCAPPMRCSDEPA